MTKTIAITVPLLVLASACGSDVEPQDDGGGGSGGEAASSTTTATTTSAATSSTTSSPAATTSTTSTSTGTGGSGGGGGGACVEPDGPGDTITLLYQNDSFQDLYLALGCGSVPPVEVTLDGGETLRIDPEAVDFCQFTCDRLYEGDEPTGCSDCGPGGYFPLPAGAVGEIEWDRLAYREATVPAACTGLDEDHFCAYAVRVEGGPVEAVAQVCDDEFPGGYCSESARRLVPFTIDLDQATATIVIGP